MLAIFCSTFTLIFPMLFGILLSIISLIISSFCSIFLTTVKLYSKVLPAYLWLKSIWALPDPTNLTMPLLPSISTSSPTVIWSALSLNFLNGISLVFEVSLTPNPFSGGISIFTASPTSALSRASSNPFNSQPAPTATNLGLKTKSSSNSPIFFPSSSIVVSIKSPVSLTFAVKSNNIKSPFFIDYYLTMQV